MVSRFRLHFYSLEQDNDIQLRKVKFHERTTAAGFVIRSTWMAFNHQTQQRKNEVGIFL